MLVNPITDKNVCIVIATVVAGGAENKLFTIGGEHREGVETIAV